MWPHGASLRRVGSLVLFQRSLCAYYVRLRDLERGGIFFAHVYTVVCDDYIVLYTNLVSSPLLMSVNFAAIHSTMLFLHLVD